MNKVLVYKLKYDWYMECPYPSHGTCTVCPDWQTALEAAYGHLCMYHRKN